jgi:uncharacterized protein YecT (DUF1311 family)
MSSLLRLLVSTGTLLAPLAHAASVDCKLAHTPREHAICDDPQFAALDARVSSAYKTLLARVSPTDAALVQSDQRVWLQWLDSFCLPPERTSPAINKQCLTDEYKTRLLHLDAGPQLPDGHTFFPRSHYVFVPANNAPTGSGVATGYGEGFFFWPQIDRPTPHEAAWNQAIYAYAISLTSDSSHHPTSFDDAVDPATETSLPYVIRSANSTFISVRHRNYSALSEGGNSTNVARTFNWWLDRGRALQPSDIFLDATHWQTLLIDPAIAKLNVTLKNAVLDGDELRKRVAEGITNPNQWTLSSSGLELVYSEYTVTPFVDGNVLVDFSWQELKPYLNPAFDPTLLPPLIQ